MSVPWFVGPILSAGFGLMSSLFGGQRRRTPLGPMFTPSLLPHTEPVVPQISGLQNPGMGGTLTYGAAGPINSTEPGLPLGVLGGKARVGLQIINAYVFNAGTYDIGYLLCGVCEGPVSEVVYNADENNIWLTDTKKLKDTKATYETNLGTASQTTLSWFQSLHRIVQLNQDMRVQTKIMLHAKLSEYYPPSDGWTCSAIVNTSWTPHQAVTVDINYGFGAVTSTETTQLVCIKFPDHSSAYLEGGRYPSYWPLRMHDFTFDCHIYPNSSLSTGMFVPLLKWQNEADDSGWAMGIKTGTATTVMNLEVRANACTTAFDERILAQSTQFSIVCGTTADGSSGVPFSLDFSHIAISRLNGRFMFFKDGDELENLNENNPNQCDQIPNASANVLLAIGRMWTGAADSTNYMGLIDEIRFVHGVSVITSTYTVSTSEYNGFEGLPRIKTRTAVDEVDMHLTFPYGLYDADQVGSSSVSAGREYVSYQIWFKDSTWDDDEFEWLRKTTEDGLGYNMPRVFESVRSAYKIQHDIPFKCINYDARSSSTSLDFGPRQTGTMDLRYPHQIKGQTSSAMAYVWKDYRSSSNVGTLFLFAFNENGHEFIENEQIQVVAPVGEASTYEATVDAPPSGTDPIVAGKAVYYRRSNYEFFVWRYTRDPADNECSEIMLSSIDEILHESLAYPHTAQLGIRYPYGGPYANSDLGPVSVLVNRGSQDLPTWPSGVYARDTSIPAWFALDLLTNTRYGCGIDIADISSADFVAWETYTEGTVDGNARAKWNGIIDSEMSMQDAIAEVEKIGRARIVEVGAQRKIMIETVGTASNLFTAGNILTNSFGMTYLPRTGRPHGFRVWYHDATRDYKKIDYLYRGPNFDNTTEPLIIPEEFLIGCTSEDEAKRYAILRYQLGTFPNAQIAFETGIDAMAVLPGDIIRVIHDSNKYAFTGRIVSGDEDDVTIDRNISIPTAWTGYLTICFRDSNSDSLVTAAITPDAGYDADGTAFSSVAANWGGTNPDQYDVFAIYHKGLVGPINFRVLSCDRTQSGHFRILAVEYVEDAYYHPDYGSTAI